MPFLSIVLRKFTHKDRNMYNRIVGAYRNYNCLLCPTMHIAMAIFVRFFEKMDDLSFTVENLEDGTSPWWRLPLVPEWSATQQSSKVFKDISNEVEVNWRKVTHLRACSMEYASTHLDLSNDELATMSKHKTEKNFSYVSELKPTVMENMAACTDGKYRLIRDELDLSFFGDEDDLVEKVFPKINVWREQQNGLDGDKSSAAS